MVDAHLESGADIDEDGIDDAFELLNEVSEHVRTGEACPLSKFSCATKPVSSEACSCRQLRESTGTVQHHVEYCRFGMTHVEGSSFPHSCKVVGSWGSFVDRFVGGRLLHLQQQQLAAELLRWRRGAAFSLSCHICQNHNRAAMLTLLRTTHPVSFATGAVLLKNPIIPAIGCRQP